MRTLVYSFLAAITLLSCGESYHYDAEKSIPNGVWTYADTLVFAFSITDTTSKYNLYVDITRADTFPTQNVYLRMHTIFPGGKRTSSVLSFDFFNSKGEVNGDCSGSRCTLRSVLQQNAFFRQPGEYQLVVEQFMRRDSLPGIQSVGVMVEKSPKS
jgi:gliding motility-associated lipoprotein GldH